MHWRFEKRRTKLYMGKKIYAMLLIAIAIMIGVYIYKYSKLKASHYFTHQTFVHNPHKHQRLP